jgi:GT2 family glycosyltransferase
MTPSTTEKIDNSIQTRNFKLEVVSATRLSEHDFWEKSPLGRSLCSFAHDPCFVSRISFENKRGLSEIYNESIQAPHDHEILLFVHDDIWLNDYFLVDRLVDSLKDFDVVGLAGNRRRSEQQIAWFSTGNNLIPDLQFLSGVVGQGKGPFDGAKYFGPTPAACELLDGAFLAVRKKTLRDSNVLFDPQFDFHFYDMDFCRTARNRNLKLGTSRISITHQSIGNFDSPAWRAKSKLFLEKWKT